MHSGSCAGCCYICNGNHHSDVCCNASVMNTRLQIRTDDPNWHRRGLVSSVTEILNGKHIEVSYRSELTIQVWSHHFTPETCLM